MPKMIFEDGSTIETMSDIEEIKRSPWCEGSMFEEVGDVDLIMMGSKEEWKKFHECKSEEEVDE